MRTPSRTGLFRSALAFTPIPALLLAPTLASASIHADIGGSDIWQTVAVIWQVIGILGGLAMLTAGILFWRRGMTSAVLACLAIQTLPGVLSRILLWSYQSTGTFPGATQVGTTTLFAMIGGAVTVLQWCALGVALGVLVFRQPDAQGQNTP